jgi:hypothetical protein
MIFEIIAITVLVVLISGGLGYYKPIKLSITNIWERQPYNRKKLILCVLGWFAFLIISSVFATAVIAPAFGKTVSMVYSFFAGVAMYLFWYTRYQKMRK